MPRHNDSITRKSIPGMLAEMASSHPDNPALLAPGLMPCSYRDLLSQIGNTARWFASLGVVTGDKVAIVVPDSPETAALFLGTASVAACAPLNPKYRSSDFELYLSDLKPKLVVVESQLDSPVRDVAASLGICVAELHTSAGAQAGCFEIPADARANAATYAGPDDVALVLHTSGTTARPKVVPISHANLLSSAANIACSLALSPLDRCLNIMPLFHVHGLIGALLSSLSVGSSVVCSPGFQAPLFFEWMKEFRPTWYSGVPTMHQAILERAPDNSECLARNALRFIRSCSAALPPQTMTELEKTFRVPVVEAYGMTEASHQMASNPLPPLPRKPGSVGLPTGVRIGIMNGANQMLPTGSDGEIVIQGPSVIAGYENNPEANLKSFTNGWFHTGDQGHLDEDGYLFITGRIKELIVRGGEKISPREIDELLLSHPAVAQAVAFAIPDAKLGEEVGAAVVLKPGHTVTELDLREHVAKSTADFKVPRRVIFVERIPTGPTGKPQRIGLAKILGLGNPAAGTTPPGFVAPCNATEKALATMWEEVLHRSGPSIHDDFFSSGGDSILATQLTGRIQKHFGLDLSIQRLFAASTIAALAAWIDEQAPVGSANRPGKITRIDRSGDVPLSFPQRRMWFAAQYVGDSPVYNRGFALRLRGPLDLFRLQQSLTAVVERHEILRTKYHLRDGVPVQTVGAVRPVAVSLVDLSREPEPKRMAIAGEWIRDEIRKPFQLGSDQMLRTGLAKIGSNEHIVLFVTHHIAFDATSQAPFLRDLAQAYNEFSRPLPHDQLDYVDFAAAQAAQSSDSDPALEWWKRELRNLSQVHSFPQDFPHPARQTYRGGTASFAIDGDLAAKLKSLGHELQATPFMVLLAAFHALIFRYSGYEDSVVGTPVAGRDIAETENIVGLFVNLLVLRTRVDPQMSFRELLARVRSATLNALDHRELPFERLVEGLSPERSLSHSPLFQLMFEYRNHPSAALHLEGLSVEPFDFESGYSQYDLHLDMRPMDSGISCLLHYNADVFKRETAERILQDYVALLANGVRTPEERISALECSVDAIPSAEGERSAHHPANSQAIVRARRSPEEPSRLSFAQERLWFLHQLEPDNAAYNIPVFLRLTGNLDREALRRAFEFVLRRHESLRTVFQAKDGAPVQYVRPLVRFELGLVDTASLAETELHDVARREVLRPFDLSKDVMLRAVLYRHGPESHSLLIVVHHIAADGWSMPILHQELGIAYSCFIRGQEPRLPQLPIQYTDFTEWQRALLTGKVLQEQLQFWTKQLAGAPSHPLLLTDRPRGPRQTYSGERYIVPVDPEFEAELTEFNRRERVTLFMALLSGLQCLLHRMTGQSDIVVGAPIANRTRVELEPLIGFFVNTLALRCDFAHDPTFREVLAQIRETTLQAYQNQDLPFEKLVQALQPERSLSHTPIFQVIFAVQNTPDENAQFGDLSVSAQDIDERVAKFDLSIFVEFKPKLRIVYNANCDLFERETVVRFARNLENLVRSAIASPDTRVSQLGIMSRDEKAQVLAWGRNSQPYPQKTVHEIFEAVVEENPDSIAVVAGASQYTYRELNNRANEIAAILRQLGVGEGKRVGLLMRRSLETIASMLAVLKVGAAYVPLDRDYPSQRLEFISNDCALAAVLTSPDLVDRAPVRKQVVRLDETEGLPCEFVSVKLVPDRAAYVMYTSGSTGQPKGVEVTHKGIVRLVFAQEFASFGPDETILQLAPLSFDASTLEVWAALLHGGKCVLYSGSRIDAEQVGAAVRTHGISTLWLTSSLFNSIIDDDPDALAPVRQLLAGGEALSVPHVRRALSALKNTQLINGYGPTENTTFSCCHRITSQNLANRASVPIGKPIANTNAYVLDTRLELVPVGLPGELYLGGDGLALGYVNRPELTAERFIFFALPDGTTERLYRTGDICRWLNDGTIEFLGRKDEQVKIRGFRIELGEIEAALAGNPHIKSVAVIVTGEGTNKRLVAYVTATAGKEMNSQKLREYLRQSLPEYMIPSQFAFLAELPVSRNGKIDKTALPDPGNMQAPRVTAPHDPVEAKLKSIWENVLGTAPIGTDQDFFELGGHSLLATKLLARVERAFGVKLPIASIFQFSTIAEFAPLLRNQVVMSQPAGSSKPPLLWVGGGTFLRPIAKWLQPDRSLISISLADEWSKVQIPYQLENIAASLAERILREHPKGPYFLGGWCYEGLLAYETAHQLRVRGAEVGLLVLVDAATPGSRSTFSRTGEVVARMQREVFHLKRLLRAGPSNWLPYMRDRFEEFLQQIKRKKWQNSYQTGQENRLSGTEECNRILHLAIAQYTPQPYPGSLLFFQASDRPSGKYWDLAWEWKELAGPRCDCREVPGDHVTVLKPPNIDTLAEHLKSALDSALENDVVTQSATVSRS